MIIGIVKEIKVHEYRVGMTPAGVYELKRCGHTVLVETNSGDAIGFSDKMYIEAGATILDTAQEVFVKADMIVKVKEPQEQEYDLIRENQILFTYLHLAPDKKQADALLKSKSIAIAYETVTDNNNQLPLLSPMSEVAGRLAIQVGAAALEKHNGGSGILLGGVPGVSPANVVIIGAGVVGLNAVKMALGMHADVTILDTNLNNLRKIDNYFNGRVKTLYSNNFNLLNILKDADLVIGAVLIPGATAPKLITKEMLKSMKKGSVLVDVAIDQGGCFETSKITTHQNPTYIVDGVIHYCVANMPGAVARTSTLALSNATLPFILNIANNGWVNALKQDSNLKNGLNICKGVVTHVAVANALNYSYIDPNTILSVL